MPNVKQKIGNTVTTAKRYWKSPAKGNYVPYKEIVSLGLAGFGVHWTTTLASNIGLDAANFLVGASIGLKPLDLSIMLIVANIIGIPLGIFRGWYYDNHKIKGGKFLPFLKICPFPIVLISTVFVWLPFENWNYITKAVVVEIFFMVVSFVLSIYNDSFAYIQQIISPNAQERATVMSISQIIFSLAPSITGFVIPTIAGLTWGLNNIKTYRIIYPAFTVVGLVVGVIFFRHVNERLILPKRKIEYVSIMDSIREVSKNKYFWIINSATWIGFLEGACGVILSWSFVYAFNGEKQAQLGIANIVIGNAALWSMLLAPLVIKKFGKRNLLIGCNIINILLFAILYFSYKNLLMICVIMFINNFINTFGNIYFPNINADMRDYHQWKTGVRVDGIFVSFGVIGTVIGFITGPVLPAIYEHMGLKDDYDVLYNDVMRNNLFHVLIICSIIGAALNVIPYLFYDLTESKHKGYVNVLKIRAMFEDYGCGVLDDDELQQGIEIINTAEEYKKTGKKEIDKSALAAAKAMPKSNKADRRKRREAIRTAKADIKSQIKINKDLDSMPIVIEELEKFSTLRYKLKLEAAEKTALLGPVYFYEDAKGELKSAKALPKRTKEEREIRSDAISLARSKKTTVKLINKYGYDYIKKPNEAEKEEIQNRETKRIADAIQARRDLKAYVKAASVYTRAVSVYENAQNLLTQAENFSHLSDIEKLYNEICIQSAPVSN